MPGVRGGVAEVPSMKPRPHYQGRAIVERGNGGDLLVMLPDGETVIAVDALEAERKVRAWFKRHNPTGFGVGTIEWRGGLEPAA
jgi:hypothetical protein